MLFLGLDGGGTKTEAVLCDEKGEVLARGFGGPSNLGELEESVVVKSIESALSPLKDFLEEETVAVLGMPAVGEIRGIESEYSRIFESTAGFKPKLVVNDVVIAWASGTLGRDGIHVVAGTGSIAYGRFKGRELRSGGWGSLIGDEGSAYHIGVETLRVVSMEIDGRINDRKLRDFVFERMNFKDHYDFIGWVYRKDGDRRSKIASVAVLTHEAALEGNEMAIEILKSAGRELSKLVVSISKKLEFEKPLVTYSGSVLEKNEFVLESFRSNLFEDLGVVEVEKSKLAPVMGALVLGMRFKGIEIPWR